MPKKPKRHEESEEYRFKIDAYSAVTIPMVRLAEYMHELALILGEPEHVHFDRVKNGSTVVVHHVDHEAVPKVRHRVSLVKSGDAPDEAMRAYRTINRYLRDDNGAATWRGRAVVLPFPGVAEAQEEFPVVRQRGFVDGVVTSIRGMDETTHIMLATEGKVISGLHTSTNIGKQLGAKYRETVRLYGRGKWRRDSDGSWTLEEFKIEGFDPLDDAPLSEALKKLRSIPTDWDDSAYGELGVIRHGPASKSNGGS